MNVKRRERVGQELQTWVPWPAAGGDLTGMTAWVAAVRAYHHDDAYVPAVCSAVSAYAARTDSD